MEQTTLKKQACDAGRRAASAAKKSMPMKKLAQGDSTAFDERVPSNDVGMQMSETQGQPQPMKEADLAPGSDQYAAVPNAEGFQNAEGMDEGLPAAPPEMIGAAHSFLGPDVMQAAIGGDPNAQDLIARTAAQVGSAFMTMSANTQPQQDMGAQPGMEGMEGQEQAQMAPPAITSPEEDLAAELVPNVISPVPQAGMNQGMAEPIPGQSAPEGAAPAEGEPEGEGENQKVDIGTVAKLINLAKAGKI